ncbi:DUF4190 domain-containing protein [Rothia kristinae]|uniref:DUF4190 domain-containing protein n=1 Tax=Rothia kristinae TaxID=37923 RepID=A0A7T4T3P9_9MICC|nr:DUF4190 domain-containing protein [Rothia kristinae]QQC58800.1 DUF4190 domain-containing protein [Rothia kristinae]
MSEQLGRSRVRDDDPAVPEETAGDSAGPPPKPGDYMPAPAPPPPGDSRAQSQAATAMALGVVGLVTGLGVIFGPIALVQAKRAREGGADASSGRILGWLATIVGVICLILFVIALLVFFGIIVPLVKELAEHGSSPRPAPTRTVTPTPFSR